MSERVSLFKYSDLGTEKLELTIETRKVQSVSGLLVLNPQGARVRRRF